MREPINDKDNTSINKNMRQIPHPLLVTTGEPAGIGMDIILQLAMKGALSQLNHPIVVLADAEALKLRWAQIYADHTAYLTDDNIDDSNCGDVSDDGFIHVIAHAQDLLNSSDITQAWQQVSHYLHCATTKPAHKPSYAQKTCHHPASLMVIDVPCADKVMAGKLNIANAAMVMQQLQLSHHLASQGLVAAIVTGPLHKSVLIDAGLTLADGSMFTGHTEFFMQQCGCDKVVMMLANRAMRVALVTTHLPLRAVADAITTANVRQTVQIVLDDLQRKFAIRNPKVLVCGLNPHAGEGGHLGMEEIEIINPVLREFQKQGVDISLAMPADTLFTTRHLQGCDAVIAMYHDQGLPVLKSHGFGDTVNLTLGLPYIRTSVDHGTALDLAGNRLNSNANSSLNSNANSSVNDNINKEGNGGQASSSSLWQALKMADEMAYAVSG